MNYSELWKRIKPFAVADIRAIGTSGGTNTSTGGVATMASHELASTSGLGAYHSVSGLTAGQVLKATGATTAGFGNLTHSQLTGVGANDHHNQVHSITGTDHSITASQYQVVGATSTNTLGLLTPSADVSGGGTSILRSNAGSLGLLSIGSATTLTLNPTTDLLLSPAGLDTFLLDTGRLRSTTYTPGFPLAGFQLGPTTKAGQTGLTIGYLQADELRVRIFVADETRVDRGQLYVTKSYGILSRDFTVPASIGTAEYIYFENSPHIAGALFTENDWVMLGYLDMSSGIVLTYVWGQVSSYYTTGLTGEQRWQFTLRDGATSLAFVKGALGVNFGASGQGYILLAATGTNSPTIQIGGWTTNPYTPANRSVKVQLGKLDELTGGTNEYGLWAAGANSGDHLLISPTSGFELVAGNGIISLTDADGVTLEAGSAVSTARSVNFTDGTNVIAYLTGVYGSGYNYMTIQATDYGSRIPRVDLLAGGSGAYNGEVNIYAYGSGTYAQIIVDGGAETIDLEGAVSVIGTLSVSSTLTVATINKSTGVSLQYGGNTKLATSSTGVSVTGSISATGDVSASGVLYGQGGADLYRGGGSGAAYVSCGYLRTADGDAQAEFYAASGGGNRSLFIHRAGGTNGASSFVHYGTGIMYVGTNDAAQLKLRTNNTVRVTIDSTGETKAENGLYVNGNAGGIAGYVGFTDTTSGVSTGTGKIMMNSTSSNVESDGWLTIYVGTTTAYIPYWTSHT